MVNVPVFDLHCDLLDYLIRTPQRSALDPRVHCSLPQLSKGNVSLQTLAIFTSTDPGSSIKGLKQVESFLHILEIFNDKVLHVHDFPSLKQVMHEGKIGLAAAFESASGFCEEQESLQMGLNRLQSFLNMLKSVIYISLTWNGENRFGGGIGSKMGLKDDGKHLLQWLNGKNIAIDLSHASDLLAEDILEYIDKENLNLRILASHCNYRSIMPVPRNLTDEIAKEIILRGGLIGHVFFKPFIGADSTHLIKHIEHALYLGGSESVCFGSDFFYEKDSFPGFIQQLTGSAFLDDLSSAADFQPLLGKIKSHLNLSEKDLNKLAHENCLNFLKRLWGTPNKPST